MSDILESIIRKHALKNAADFGKANAGSVVGKVIAEVPGCKKDMKKTMELINRVVKEINSLPKEKIEKELSQYTFIEKPAERPKKMLEANGPVITRFPPEPSGHPHIGHAKAAWLDHTVAQENNGHMVLRFDDTNPEKESQEFVDAIKDGLRWLGIHWKQETFTSDNVRRIYEYAEQLIKQERAYVCTAPQEEISQMRTTKKPLKDRANTVEKNLALWDEMKKGKKYVLLFKGDLDSQNTVMRDPALARVMTAKHYKQGTSYAVWPGYDLAVVVMDHLEGITHSMRSKEYELRDELYYCLCDALGFKRPELIGFSRLDIKNAPISKRLLKPLVEEGKVGGWDDPRLPTISGLRRRGVLPEAIRDFVLSFGLSKVESEPGWEKLLVENRKLLDPVAKHYFFVPQAVAVLIDLTGEQKYKIRGEERIAHIKDSVLIPKNEFEGLHENEILALKDLAFVKFTGKEFKAVNQKEIPQKKIQWVSQVDAIHCEVLIPHDLLNEDGTYNEESLERVEGYCEKACALLNEGDIIQFERFGFCRLDKKTENKLTFVFSC